MKSADFKRGDRVRLNAIGIQRGSKHGRPTTRSSHEGVVTLGPTVANIWADKVWVLLDGRTKPRPMLAGFIEKIP